MPQPNLLMPGHLGRIGVGAPGWKELKLVIFLAQCRKECGHCKWGGGGEHRVAVLPPTAWLWREKYAPAC